MRYHADRYEDDGSVYIADRPCSDSECQLGSQVHLHVFTDDELRARDERIIRATRERTFSIGRPVAPKIDEIVAAAEARQ